MTWEETIQSIRKDPEYASLVKEAYFDADLRANVERFRAEDEFRETLGLIRKRGFENCTLVDIGSGNGISTIAFALEGYKVFSVEPDPSTTVGAGAIRTLTEQYQVKNKVTVVERYGEDTGLPPACCEVVYVRQAMHHANDLKKMLCEFSKLLKPGGLLITVRDHVIFNQKDKEWFLEKHPLHKFYGGENAFTEGEYLAAMNEAGFHVDKILRYYDSVINYFPLTEPEMLELPKKKEQQILNSLRKKVGPLADIPFVRNMYKNYLGFNTSKVYDEAKIPGRMYSFIARKPL